MSLATLAAKNIIKRIVAGGMAFAILHAIIFWISWFQCGGFKNSFNALERAASAVANQSFWLDLNKWTGFPLSGVHTSSHGAFVIVMILNSLLWGIAVSIIGGIIFGRKK